MDYNSKFLFITGGSRRIGLGIAKFYASIGYSVAIHFNSSTNDANLAKEEIYKIYQKLKNDQYKKDVNGSNLKCEIFQADLNNKFQVEDLLNKVYTQFGLPNLVINNASVFEKSSARVFDEDNFDVNFNIHLKSPVKISSFFYNKFLEEQNKNTNTNLTQGLTPSIINICDSNIVRYKTKYFYYLLSKQSLCYATKLMASEFAPILRINAIMPGYIIGAQNEDKDYLQNLKTKIPMQNNGEFDDIIKAVDFFVNSNYITGQCIYVDGGMNLVSI
jgi:pteridine reductase